MLKAPFSLCGAYVIEVRYVDFCLNALVERARWQTDSFIETF